MMRRTRRSRIAGWLLVLMVAAATPLLAHDHAAPDPLDDADPFAEIHAHREMEARNKCRLLRAADESLMRRTPNQDLYDVHHYDLTLDLNPSTEQLDGVGVTTVSVETANLNTLDLNLDAGLDVTAVSCNGAPVTWSRSGGILTVNLDRTYIFGETVAVEVHYDGDPSGSYFGWDSHGGETMIWTLSEPYGARTWWPCKDLNTDKADSLDIRVTVPDDLVVASNGLLISDVDHGSTRTFHWKTNYPIVTYLVSLAIHPYHTFSTWYTPLDSGPDMEIQHYVFSDQVSSAPDAYAPTDEMITVFANAFGEYPFVEEKYGHASFTWGGGMEHQTMTSMGGLWHDVISHELAHQWFGDLITCADFGHIWLNEGFAVWCEAYWKEISDSWATYQSYMAGAAYMGSGTIFVEDPSDFYSIFDVNLSYNKASWVVHMLRGVLGDEDFFAGLALYRETYGFGSATTEQFRDVMETVSGRDLDAYFQQWIYGPYFPVYAPSYGLTQNAGQTLVDLTIEQVQSNAGVFTMPIDVRITTTDGVFDFVVENDQQTQSWQLAVTGDILGLQIDPDDWILCRVEEVVSDPTFHGGILLVNGVSFSIYDEEIRTAYRDSIFTGDHPYDFWDVFATPSGGYPAELPSPLGHGAVPAVTLGAYSTVVWVGNDYQGDLELWEQTAITSYLEAGGNVLLMTRYAEEFFDAELTGYLGVTWTGSTGELSDLTAVHPGLVDETITGSQTYNNVFQQSIGSDSTLLMTGRLGGGGPYGAGVIAIPPAGGAHRDDGGRFALLCGRPYRVDHGQRRANTDYILSELMLEPYRPYSSAPQAPAVATGLRQNHPNPFNPSTTLSFSLATAGSARLDVYDVQGRLVRTLFDGRAEAHETVLTWDGRDGRGRSVASGTYFARLQSAEGTQVRAMTLVR